ncbi:WD40 repeat domain-containing serine/threonine protein kinase [Micromonospora eburnea]|uniref:Serine/threonine protein kinase n=1 Tax=Micromonospora eburnea TaxID=227316 RepID=A0A1C6U529_9ACTN|nr:serine/threonine-protein kinase [Micromonospora eburnea]SCL48979.1 Serine/threonine protein kinase [Micromonospora eburnea]
MADEVGQLGDYRLLRLLGAGGMGYVYFGVSSTGDRVAVKVIRQELVSDEDLRRRFAAEIENLKLVYGSRVARLEDADPLGDPAWLAVQYVPGATVNQYVAARGPLPVRLAAMAGAMLADGLARVHQAGVLHRDLKPQNVILGPDGPVLIDFGLAVLTEQDSRFTQTGLLIGTPAYMSPEQVRGERALTAAVDIYALGATLVYAATGHDLYPGAGGVHSLLLRIADPQVAPDLAGVPDDLMPVLTDMLAHEPAARPALATVRSRLLAVAGADGTDVSELRRQVAELTYSAATELLVPRVDAPPPPGPPPTVPAQPPLPSPPPGGRRDVPAQPPPPTRHDLPPAPTRVDGASAPLAPTRTDAAAEVGMPTRRDPSPVRPAAVPSVASPTSPMDPRGLLPPEKDRRPPGVGDAPSGEPVGPPQGDAMLSEGTPATRVRWPRRVLIALCALLLIASAANLIYRHQQSKPVRVYDKKPTALAFNPDGTILASADDDEMIRLWDVDGRKLLGTLFGQDGVIDELSFSPDGDTLASANDSGQIKLWNMTTRQETATLDFKVARSTTVSFSPDGTMLAGGADTTIKVWKVGSTKALTSITGLAKVINKVRFSGDSKTVLGRAEDGSAGMWDARTGARRYSSPGIASSWYVPTSSGSVEIRDPGGGLLGELRGHDGPVKASDFHGGWLVTGGYDKTVRLWNVTLRREVDMVTVYTWAAESVALSPKTLLVAYGNYKGLWLWRPDPA